MPQPKLLSLKAGELTIGDALLIAVSKNITERVSAPIIGNATLFSGAVKTGLGVLLTGWIGGKIGNIIGTGLVVDGAEDFIGSFLGGAIGELVGGRTGGSVNVM